MRHFYVTGDAIALHCVETGAGEPIIFLHGFPEFWRTWRRVMLSLGERYRCVAPDMRGFNLSDKPRDARAYTLAHTTGDVSTIADALGLQTFTLVGHNWGGIVAWRYAELFPDRLRNLVIVNAPHPVLYQQMLWSDPAQREGAQYARRLAATGSAVAFAPDGPESIWNRLYHDHAAKGDLDEDERAAFLAAWREDGAIEAMLNWYRSGEIYVPALSEPYSPPSIEPPRSIATRTLVLWGEQDQLLKAALVEALHPSTSWVPNHGKSHTGRGDGHDAWHGENGVAPNDSGECMSLYRRVARRICECLPKQSGNDVTEKEHDARDMEHFDGKIGIERRH